MFGSIAITVPMVDSNPTRNTTDVCEWVSTSIYSRKMIFQTVVADTFSDSSVEHISQSNFTEDTPAPTIHLDTLSPYMLPLDWE